jgi:hypothetical protein
LSNLSNALSSTDVAFPFMHRPFITTYIILSRHKTRRQQLDSKTVKIGQNIFRNARYYVAIERRHMQPLLYNPHLRQCDGGWANYRAWMRVSITILPAIRETAMCETANQDSLLYIFTTSAANGALHH